MEFLEVQSERVPLIGLGTWNMRGDACYRAVLSGLELGYRHIDTAEMYRNEEQVGRAMIDSEVDRSEIFLVTKVSASHLRYDDLMRAAEASLSRLAVDAIDVYLVHWPNDHIPIEDTMRAMNALIDDGRIRHAGVSNFSVRQIEQAQSASDIKLFTNQIEHYLGLPQRAMLEWCQANDVMLTAYSPLDRGRLSRSGGTLGDVARAHNATPAQAALRWLIQQDMVAAIPKSANSGRQRENLDVFHFELTDEELNLLGSL